MIIELNDDEIKTIKNRRFSYWKRTVLISIMICLFLIMEISNQYENQSIILLMVFIFISVALDFGLRLTDHKRFISLCHKIDKHQMVQKTNEIRTDIQ
jgi:hypothetical protein